MHVKYASRHVLYPVPNVLELFVVGTRLARVVLVVALRALVVPALRAVVAFVERVVAVRATLVVAPRATVGL